MAVIKLVPLVLLVVAGAFAIRRPNLHWAALPSAAAIGQGAVLLFFAFMGIEGGLSMSGEVVNPARTMPRAILMTLTLVAALYIGLQLATQGVLGAAILPNSKGTFVATATALFGPWGTRLFVVATVLSASGYLVADMLASPRTVYALAEAGQAPAGSRPYTRDWNAGRRDRNLFVLLLRRGGVRIVPSARGRCKLRNANVYLICCLGLLRLRARNIAMEGKPFRAPGGASRAACGVGHHCDRHTWLCNCCAAYIVSA